MLEWGKLDVNETIGFIKAKEMARDAMKQPAFTTSVFLRKTTQKQRGKVTFNMCSRSTKKLI